MMQSDEILNGNLNLETKLFITAPLFPYLLAAFKWIFGSKFIFALEAFQIILSSVSAACLMLTSKIIFKSDRVALLSGFVFCIYPITLYYSHQFSQESIFQSLFIISIYFYCLYISDPRTKSLLLFTIIFSLALLTKSIILPIFPLLLMSIIFKFNLSKKTIFQLCLSLITIFMITLPYGLYNKVVNNSYVISSSGQGGLFLTGHNDDFYTYVTNPPSSDSPEYKRLKNMEYHIFDKLISDVKDQDHKYQQDIYLNAGIKWILENPKKAFHLNWVNIRNFLMPGYNIFHHPFHLWLITFLMSLPVFLFAYIEIIRRLRIDPLNHLAISSIFVGMLSVSIIFYAQNRFRAVTIEPYYLMYACSFAIYLIEDKLKFLQKNNL
jgi:4-amino-4-deoxy-L-arabinose transferase-like glycosyltransferase